MNKRLFIMWAFLFAMVALVVHSVARSFLEDGMHRKSARLEQVQKSHLIYTPDPQAVQSIRIYNSLTLVGLALTVLSIVFMVTALMRRESGWYLILILLLLFDIMVPMLL